MIVHAATLAATFRSQAGYSSKLDGQGIVCPNQPGIKPRPNRVTASRGQRHARRHQPKKEQPKVE